MLQIENANADIISSNFWDSVVAQRGYFFISFNAGAARLLVPDNRLGEVPEMQTGHTVIISQGPLAGKAGATELLFEDGSDTPYSMHLDPAQTDRQLPQTDNGRDLVFTAWCRGPVQLFSRPAKFRLVRKLPCLEEWVK